MNPEGSRDESEVLFPETDGLKMIMDSSAAQDESERREEAWSEYSGYDDRYDRANQERTKAGKITEYHYPGATLVASIRVDASGEAISGHEQDPEAQAHRDLEASFQKYLDETPPDERLLIFEGSAQSFTDRTTAIQRRADSGLAQFLAAQTQTPAISGEPSDGEVATELERQGISRTETALFTTLRALGPQLLAERGTGNLPALICFQLARNAVPGFHELTEEEKTEISRDPQRTAEVLADFAHRGTEFALQHFNPILEEQGLPEFTVVDGELRFGIEDPTELINLASPTRDGRMNQIGNRVSVFRDRHIFEAITGAVKSGKKPFVPYGGSHIVALEPVLNRYFNQSPVQRRLP